MQPIYQYPQPTYQNIYKQGTINTVTDPQQETKNTNETKKQAFNKDAKPYYPKGFNPNNETQKEKVETKEESVSSVKEEKENVVEQSTLNT